MYTIVYNSVQIFKKNFSVKTQCKKFPSFNIEMCTLCLYTLCSKNADSFDQYI